MVGMPFEKHGKTEATGNGIRLCNDVLKTKWQIRKTPWIFPRRFSYFFGRVNYSSTTKTTSAEYTLTLAAE